MVKSWLGASLLEPSLPLWWAGWGGGGREGEWAIIPRAFLLSAWIPFETPSRSKCEFFLVRLFLKNDFWVFKRKCSDNLDINSSCKTREIALLTVPWPSSSPYPPGPRGQGLDTSGTSALWGGSSSPRSPAAPPETP